MFIKMLKPFSFLPALLLMYIIFSFSAQDGTASSELSYKVTHKIVEVSGEILSADLEASEIDALAVRFESVVRKLAHMTEYFALAVAVAFPLYVYGMRGFLLMLCAGLICVAFACGDEYHQSLVVGRNPSKRDVLIDSFGVFLGIILVRIVGWTGRHTIFRPLAKKKGDPAPANTPSGAPTYPPGAVPYPNNRTWQQGAQPSGPYPPLQGPRQPGYGRQPGSQVPPAPGYRPGGYPPNEYPPRQPAPNGQPLYRPYPPNGYNGPNTQPPQKRKISDELSEDMSLRKLMHDLKEQKKGPKPPSGGKGTPTGGSGRKGSARPITDLDVDQIDLDN